MIDLEEIDLSAAPGTSARKIRSGKKNVAKILARGQGIPSWKRSLASVRGKKNKKLAGPEGDADGAMPSRGNAGTAIIRLCKVAWISSSYRWAAHGQRETADVCERYRMDSTVVPD